MFARLLTSSEGCPELLHLSPSSPEVPLGAVPPAPGFIWTCLRNWAVADFGCGHQTCSALAQVLGAAFLAGGGVTLGSICPPPAGQLAVSPAWQGCGKQELAFSCCECFQDWFALSAAPLLFCTTDLGHALWLVCSSAAFSQVLPQLQCLFSTNSLHPWFCSQGYLSF